MSTASGRQICVLHVDDDAGCRDLTEMALEREDDRFVVETASGVEDGLERLTAQQPDCIVSDYNMPGRDGLEFLEAVRAERPELPFILFTGKGSETVASEAIAMDVTDYLQKSGGAEQYELLANRIENAVQARRDARRATRHEELMTLTEYAGDTGGLELDPESGALTLTSGTRRLVGLPEDADLSFEDAIELYHPDDRDAVRQAIETVCETGDERAITQRLQTVDGDERHVEVTLTPVTSNGDVTTVRGAIKDVTRQRDRQRELETERQFIQQSLDSLDELFYVAGLDGNLQRWNDRVPEVTGYTDAELAEMNVLDLLPEARHEAATETIETICSGEDTALEAPLLTADGQHIPYEFTGRQLTSPDGDTTGSVRIGRDISDRRQRERRFQALVEESSDIISIVDAAGRFEYQSPSVERILGYDPAETVGEVAWEYMHPDDREEVEEAFRELVENPTSTTSFEYRARHADGSWRWMEARCNEPADNPAVDGYVINSRDVTARKRNERQLEKREQTLRELHTATREFYPPSDDAAVAEFLVGFLSGAFDFSYISAELFDADENCLQPAARWSESVGDTVAIGPIEPGPNPVWRAYEQGDPQPFHPEEHATDLTSTDASVDDGVAVPVGDFGVVVVCPSDDAPVDAVARSLLDVVTANAESAFRRLRAAETNADVAAELSAKQTKVRELTAIIEVYQQFHETVADKGGSDSLDRSICDCLTATDRIDFAWVGRPDGLETNLRPTARAGQEGGYLGGTTLDGGDESVPAQRVVCDHEPCSIGDIGAYAKDTDWAKHALAAGFRSVVCVPLVRDGVLYGVLSAYSTDEGEFDERHRDLVANAGSLLVDYSRTLADRYEETTQTFTVLEFELSDSTYPFQELVTTTDDRVRVDAVLETTDTEMQVLVSVLRGDPTAVLERATSVTGIAAAERFGAESNQLSVRVERPFLASVVGRHGAVLHDAVSDADGTCLRIKLPTQTSKRPVLDSLSSAYPGLSLVAQRQVTDLDTPGDVRVEDILTDRQHEILTAAFHSGYYETPKRVTGSDIATMFDISNTAVHDHLNTAIRRVLEAVLDSRDEYQI